ncbi:MAG: 2-succinyl-6-hydroxy-2,4-cyclohexadiene-1-carboxylate synthase [Solirubrobacteraceae bacterium]
MLPEPPQLVLLHGFTNTGASWKPVVRALGESYSVLSPDIRGHGAAADAQPVSLDHVLGDLSGLVEAPRFTLAGYSMGGRIALHAALAPALSARIERLVLIGASPGIANATERRRRQQDDERLADEISRSEIDAFAQRWAATPVLAGVPHAVAAAAHEDRLRNTPAGLARALRGLGTGALPSLWDRLPELSMPVALIVGERDGKFRRVAEQMLSAIAGARLVVVPGAGHAAHLEAPTETAAVIRA